MLRSGRASTKPTRWWRRASSTARRPNRYIWVANQRFRGRTDLVLLHIDPTRLRSEVRYENLEGGETLFPHVYGAIPIGAVLNVIPLRPLEDGSFVRGQTPSQI